MPLEYWIKSCIYLRFLISEKVVILLNLRKTTIQLKVSNLILLLIQAWLCLYIPSRVTFLLQILALHLLWLWLLFVQHKVSVCNGKKLLLAPFFLGQVLRIHILVRNLNVMRELFSTLRCVAIGALDLIIKGLLLLGRILFLLVLKHQVYYHLCCLVSKRSKRSWIPEI